MDTAVMFPLGHGHTADITQYPFPNPPHNCRQAIHDGFGACYEPKMG